MESPETETSLSRRSLIGRGSLALAAALLAPRRLHAALVPERRLRLCHTHTGERVDVVFKRGGEWVDDGIAALNHNLRDFRRNEVHPYDPGVFDILADLQEKAGRPNAEYQVICGYRTPTTNEMLRSRTTGVAERSLHMAARAIDVRLPGVATDRLRDTALAMRRGGVGYYRASDFIHVDTGRVRRW
jgi:uncharacterized protein YcbK (DUF882 family)